ncbi:hypothetical protein M378DRAFT_855503 [Amanita muscaria Koide BX008]|uniref:Uncharacterized protein n=1 Tax=Amanita muscaria (strain Koide BX008) TaxID=946122 RepID=A0A0C2T4I4_AMAMK|nr:hypothetical protein M378DRAFT_855503 [Amanita muscaria Koide BX008]
MNPILTSTWSIRIPPSFMAAILFGLYLASFAHCVRWLLFEDEGWKVRKKVNRVLATTTLLVFFLSTVSISTTAALETPFSGTHAPAYFSAVTILSSTALIHFSILIIIDGVLIHRCWIVFSKNWFIICFPLALWCSSLICAIISFYCDISLALYTTDPAIRKEFMVKTCTVGPYVGMDLLTFCVCNIVVSIYTTSALVYKIWRAAKNNAGTNHLLYRTSRILTESGILHTFPSVLYLARVIKARIIDSQPAPTVSSILLLDLVLSIERPLVGARYFMHA